METIEQLKQLALRIYDANSAGALHMVVDDGNMTKIDILYCMNEKDITQEELKLARELLAIPYWLRMTAWEAGSYLQHKDQ